MTVPKLYQPEKSRGPLQIISEYIFLLLPTSSFVSEYITLMQSAHL